MSVGIEVFPTDEWGTRVGAKLARRVDDQPGLRLCLPTGNTPRAAYRAFAEGGGSLATTEVFLLDEFGLPTGHPARCDEMLSRSLLDLLERPPRALHTFNVAAESLDEECARYGALVDAGGLDVTILGLGTNGHLGLNEPGSGPGSPTRVVNLAETTVRNAATYGDGTAPHWGITLGLRPVLDSREIWLLVTGVHKKDILSQALTGPVGPEVPASFLQNHPNTVVMADQDAAGALQL